MEKIRAEVEELRRYGALARSITVNQKAVKLNDALDQGFEPAARDWRTREGHHLHRVDQDPGVHRALPP